MSTMIYAFLFRWCSRKLAWVHSWSSLERFTTHTTSSHHLWLAPNEWWGPFSCRSPPCSTTQTMPNHSTSTLCPVNCFDPFSRKEWNSAGRGFTRDYEGTKRTIVWWSYTARNPVERSLMYFLCLFIDICDERIAWWGEFFRGSSLVHRRNECSRCTCLCCDLIDRNVWYESRIHSPDHLITGRTARRCVSLLFPSSLWSPVQIMHAYSIISWEQDSRSSLCSEVDDCLLSSMNSCPCSA